MPAHGNPSEGIEIVRTRAALALAEYFLFCRFASHLYPIVFSTLCTEDRLTFVPVARATSCWSVRAVHTIFARNARSLLTMRVSTAFVTFVAVRPQFTYFVRTRPQRRDKAP